jgi:preprotein translocase subunit SecG
MKPQQAAMWLAIVFLIVSFAVVAAMTYVDSKREAKATAAEEDRSETLNELSKSKRW